MWLQMEGKDSCLERKRVDLEDREAALADQIGEAAYLVLSLPCNPHTKPHSGTNPYLPQLYSQMLSHILNPSFDPDPNPDPCPNPKIIFSPTLISNPTIMLPLDVLAQSVDFGCSFTMSLLVVIANLCSTIA